MVLQVSYCAFYKPEILYNADHFYLYLHTNVPMLHKCTRINGRTLSGHLSTSVTNCAINKKLEIAWHDNVCHKIHRVYTQQHSCCYNESCSSLDEDIEYCQGVWNKAFVYNVAELPEK